MRRYDEPLEVRRGLVGGQEAPEQFIWRDRLWVVRDVIAHWVETGAWWDQSGIAALLGVGAETTGPAEPHTSEPSRDVAAVPLGADLLAESDVWRVEAMDGLQRRSRGTRLNKPADPAGDDDADLDRGYGVFDLAFDWAEARWRLIGCAD